MPKVGRKSVSLAEVGQIARETCIARIANAVNDVTVWKKRLDQPQMIEVVRHLIRDIFRGRVEGVNRAQIISGKTIRRLRRQ